MMFGEAPRVTYELINDPVEAAAIAERCRITKVMAEQLGCSRESASLALHQFFSTAAVDGWTMQ